MFSFGWFSSGRGQGSIDLLTAAHQKMVEGFIPGRIAYVFSDRDPGETPAADRFQAVVKSLGLPLITLSSLNLRQKIRQPSSDIEPARQEFDSRVLELLAGYDVSVVVLAGYMLVLSPRLCERLLCLNLHPAVPGGPQGTWRQVMWQLMENGAREAGAMMHLVTPVLDKGPPVTFCHFPLQGPSFDPLWQAFREKRKLFSLEDIRSTGKRSGTALCALTRRRTATGVSAYPFDFKKSGVRTADPDLPRSAPVRPPGSGGV